MSERTCCCDRFKKCVEKKEIIYAYDVTTEINETAWIAHGLWNMYYCPFCGAFIKGRGWGTYHKEHPPQSSNKE